MATSTPLQLKQTYLDEHRDFSLERNRIRLYVKDLNGGTESYVPYETVTPTIRTITQQDGRLYRTAVSFGIFALISFILSIAGLAFLMKWTLLWDIVSLLFFGFHFYRRRHYLLVDLTDGKSIFFLANKPSKDELDRFIDSIYRARKKHLREKYYFINSVNDPNYEIEKFRWLRHEKIISESEFQEMKTALVVQKKIIAARFQTKGLLN